jgi:glycerol uptake facilitator-like aquaporin
MKSKYLAEFLGTAFLFWAVVGSGIMGQNLNQNDAVTLLGEYICNRFCSLFFDHLPWRSQFTFQPNSFSGDAIAWGD